MNKLLKLAMFFTAVLGPSSLAKAQASYEETPVPQERLADTPGADVQRHVDSIKESRDPSSAVAAYSTAKSVLPTNARIDQAYVRRMVDFGLPQMADTQARALVQRDPKDGLAWGVFAFSLATRGQTADALKNIAAATKYLPDDPFIQRTAGQLLAWYDTVADKSALPQALQDSAQDVRDRMSPHREYVNAYQTARSTYEQGTNPAETGPASAEAGTLPPVEAEPPVSTEPGYGEYAYGDYDYGYGLAPYAAPYTYAYAYPSYPYYAPYWGGFYGGYWWPGAFSTVIVPRDGLFFHRHHHHRASLFDFARFPGHRFDDRRFRFGNLNRFDRRGTFDRRRDFTVPRWRRDFAARSPQTARPAPRIAPREQPSRRMPQLSPSPNMSRRGPQFTRAPSQMASARRFAMAPRSFGGGGRMGGRGRR